MTSLLVELRKQISAYLEGRSTLPELNRWLVEQTPVLADAADAEVERLSDEAWFVLAEWEAARMDEATVRQRLGDLLAEPVTITDAPFSPVVSEAAAGVAFTTRVDWGGQWRPEINPAASTFAQT